MNMRKMFGERLKLARRKSGKSLRALSEDLGNCVSAQMLSKYERGLRMPNSDLVEKFAKTLDVSIQFLLSDQISDFQSFEFRIKSRTTVRDRAEVEATVIENLQRYCNIEWILKDANLKVGCPTFEPKSVGTTEEPEQLALRLRKEWKLGLDPIPNMTELLEERGIRVLVLKMPDRVSGMTCSVKQSYDNELVSAIVVNRDHTLERRRMSLAHELGRYLISGESGVAHEKAANEFAGAFLIPREPLQTEFGLHRESLNREEFVRIKRLYRVSAATLLARLTRYGIIGQQTEAGVFRSLAKNLQESEPQPIEPEHQCGRMEQPQRFERLCYRALAEKYISIGKATTLLKQPVQKIRQTMQSYSNLNVRTNSEQF